MTRREELASALAAVEGRLAAACAAAGRAREDVRLVAVSKTRPASDVALLAELGVTDVGENKDQEASTKAAEVERLLAGERTVRWHFVGQVQRNKARRIASYATVVHSVDRLALVPALSAGAVRAGRALDVLLQVSLSDEAGRGGVPVDQLPALADAAADAPALRLAGVMGVAPLGEDPAPAFARLAACAQELRRQHPGAEQVSAGMSGDLEQAVANGATLVRVGTALFGPRPPVLR
jgi:pyridoxal phosphate enzyme (YggS family)